MSLVQPQAAHPQRRQGSASCPVPTRLSLPGICRLSRPLHHAAGSPASPAGGPGLPTGLVRSRSGLGARSQGCSRVRGPSYPSRRLVDWTLGFAERITNTASSQRPGPGSAGVARPSPNVPAHPVSRGPPRPRAGQEQAGRLRSGELSVQETQALGPSTRSPLLSLGACCGLARCLEGFLEEWAVTGRGLSPKGSFKCLSVPEGPQVHGQEGRYGPWGAHAQPRGRWVGCGQVCTRPDVPTAASSGSVPHARCQHTRQERDLICRQGGPATPPHRSHSHPHPALITSWRGSPNPRVLLRIETTKVGP